MEHKLKCAVVRDLLPNYIEKLTSEETNQEIEAHLSDCKPCTKVYEEMKAEVPTESDSIMEDAKDLSKFLRKTKAVSALKFGLMLMFALGIVVNVIVDLAVNHRITWSMIVIVSIVYAMGIISILIWGGKNRGVKTLAFATAFLIPLIYVISLYCDMYGYDATLLMRMSRRICLIWIMTVWVGVFVYKVLKQNLWIAVGVMMLLAVFGNLMTNAIANQVSLEEQIQSLDTIINSVAYVATATALFVVGHIRKGKRI